MFNRIMYKPEHTLLENRKSNFSYLLSFEDPDAAEEPDPDWAEEPDPAADSDMRQLWL